jgi:hypothetical protein
MAAGGHVSSARSSTAPLTFVTAPRELAGAGELPWPRLSSGAPTAEDIENQGLILHLNSATFNCSIKSQFTRCSSCGPYDCPLTNTCRAWPGGVDG